MSAENVTPWTINKLLGLQRGRPAGFDVSRIHSPGTGKAREEFLERGRVFRSEAEARAAIAKATGSASHG